MARPFTVINSLFTKRYPLTVYGDSWLMGNGECMVNGKRKKVNG